MGCIVDSARYVLFSSLVVRSEIRRHEKNGKEHALQFAQPIAYRTVSVVTSREMPVIARIV